MRESGHSQIERISLALGVASVIVAAGVTAIFWLVGIYPLLAGLAFVVLPPMSVGALVLGVIALVGKKGRSISALVGVLLAAAVLTGIVYVIHIGTSSR